MLKTKLCAILALILFFPIIGISQSVVDVKVQIKGIVVDSLSAETIPYATIKISKQSTPTVVEKVVATDENGKFQLVMNQAGEYLLTAEFIGKESSSKLFALSSAIGKTLDLGSILMKDNSKMLNEVVVSAQKALIKVDLDKITYSLEDDPESKTNNVLEMMRKVPMITVDGEDNIQLKGSSSYKIYINGKPSSMLTSNPKDVLKSMPANTVKDIEVITDPGAKYDAEGIGGIINIITQKNVGMGGYTATVNTNADNRGGYGLGGYLMFKVGKLGFTGNYNYYTHKSKEYDSYLMRESFDDLQNKYLIKKGIDKDKGDGQYGNGELSYEIDSLNLINIGFGVYEGKNNNRSRGYHRIENHLNEIVKEYDQLTDGTYKYGSKEFKADYQLMFKKVKDRLFTVSYRLNLAPNDWDTNNDINGILNQESSKNMQQSDGDMKEHTMQVDFTTPFSKIHHLETGLKYILRLNQSNSKYQLLGADNIWNSEPSLDDKFKHRQEIYSAYASYVLKLKKMGLKAGLRYEGNHMKVDYPLSEAKDFSTNLSNLIPSISFSYQLKQAQTLRLSYNMRISRPGIRELNPFENRTDTLNISVGNPNLKPIQSHSISLNYNFFNPKFNMNASLSYNFVNNSIERITELDGIVSKTTYANIGKNNSVGGYAYFSWSPTSKFRISGNLSEEYINIKSNDVAINLSNSGFVTRAFGNLQYSLPQNFRIGGYGGASSSYVNIQGKRPGFSYYGLSVSKGFISEKLNVSVSANSFMTKTRRYKNITETPQFRTESYFDYPEQSFGLRISYKFGELKTQIKKTVRGITNDDSMGGGSGGGNSQGGGQ